MASLSQSLPVSDANNSRYDTTCKWNRGRNYTKNLFDQNQQCQACMIEKAHLEIRPLPREHAKRPLERVFLGRRVIVNSIDGRV